VATSAVYSRTAVVLHWLIALFIACGFSLGAYMVDLHASPTKVRLFAYHKWIGITVLALVLIRSAWRLTHRPPPDLPMPR
jgi:cytochrome b561